MIVLFYRLLGVLVSTMLLFGCSDQKLLEKLGYVLAASVDIAEQESGGKTLKFSFAIPRSEEKKQIFLTTLATTQKKAFMQLSNENNYELVNGQLRMVLFGKEYAKSGISNQLDAIRRDPSIRGKVKLLVVDGDASELLNQPMPQYTATGQFIDDLLQTATKTRTIPVINLYTFSRDLYDDGIDPIAPILKRKQGKINIAGLALFKDTHYIGQLDNSQMSLFNILYGTGKEGNLNLKLKEKSGKATEIGLFHLSEKTKINVVVKHPLSSGRDIKADIDIRILGSVTEYTGQLDLEDPAYQKEIEAAMKQSIEEESMKIVKLLQKEKVDPIGIGKYVRQKTSYKEWNSVNWNDLFATADIQVNAKASIKNFGKIQ